MGNFQLPCLLTMVLCQQYFKKFKPSNVIMFGKRGEGVQLKFAFSRALCSKEDDLILR